MKRAAFIGFGHYLPQRVVDNTHFEKTLDTTDTWIKERTGITQRHFAAQDETTSDMGAMAARAALADANLKAQDIDAIVLATSTADLTFPSAATMVQHKLGMHHGFAFDVQAVCAGFVFALSTANAMIVSGQAQRVLVIGAEKFSQLMDWQDRNTCILFGDGAGAVVLEVQESDPLKGAGILATDLQSDGQYKDILYVDGGVCERNTGFLRMSGKDVFSHAVKKLAQTMENSLNKAGLETSAIDWIIPHQANLRIIESLAKRFHIPMAQVVLTVQDHGNTSAASIPLAMSVANQQKRLKKDQIILTSAIGGGLAWGSAVIRL